MSYNPTIDFISLLRQTSGGVRSARMPGLDYVIAALARAGMFGLHVGLLPPPVPQVSTVWLRTTANGSWQAESTVMLYSSAQFAYVEATAELWNEVLGGPKVPTAPVLTPVIAGGVVNVPDGVQGYSIQSTVAAPLTFNLQPSATRNGSPLRIADVSGVLFAFNATLVPAAGEFIWGLDHFTMDRAFQAIDLVPATNALGAASGYYVMA